MHYNNYQDLKVWIDSVSLVTEIYKQTRNINFNSDYGLRDQIRRSSVSIPSNIAEGFERNSNKEFIRFLRYSKSSAAELNTQLIISKNIKYINNDDFNNLSQNLNNISTALGSFINYLSRNSPPNK